MGPQTADAVHLGGGDQAVLFNTLAMDAEFEADRISQRTRRTGYRPQRRLTTANR